MSNSKNEIDSFTQKRLIRFVSDYRKQSGQLPSLRDFEIAGFPKELIEAATRKKLLEQFYITLTNRSILKVYKVRSD